MSHLPSWWRARHERTAECTVYYVLCTMDYTAYRYHVPQCWPDIIKRRLFVNSNENDVESERQTDRVFSYSYNIIRDWKTLHSPFESFVFSCQLRCRLVLRRLDISRRSNWSRSIYRHIWQLDPKPNTADQQLLFNKLLFMKQFTKCFYSKRLFHMSSLEASSTRSSEACTNIAQIADCRLQSTLQSK